MRANINLDADAYTFATTYANARGIPLGTAISELLRRAEQAPDGSSSLLTRTKSGFLVKKRTGDVITRKLAKELSEDDLD